MSVGDNMSAELFKELTKLKRQYLKLVGPTKIGDGPPPGLTADTVIAFEFESLAVAANIATKLGHIALKQGRSFECPRCGQSGNASAHLIGDIFIGTCGASKGTP